MLAKLLKYDVKRNVKVLGLYILLTVAVAVLMRIVSMQDGSFFSVIQSVLMMVLSVLLFGLVLIPILLAWAYLIRYMFQDEGYLTNTLPVKTSTIFTSTWLTGMLLLFVSLCVLAFCLWIGLYHGSLQALIDTFLNELGVAFDFESPILFLILTFFVFYLEMAFVMNAGYTGIVIGYSSEKNSFLKSILIGIGIYFLWNLILTGILLIYGLIDPQVYSMMFEERLNDLESIKMQITFVKNVFVLGIGAYLIINLFQFLMDQKVLKRCVEYK